MKRSYKVGNKNVTEQEYDMCKLALSRGNSVRNVANLLERAVSTVNYMDKSNSWQEYRNKMADLAVSWGKSANGADKNENVDEKENESATIVSLLTEILRVLEQIRDKKIDIFYIRPDVDLLIGELRLQERAIFGILQEYARSGLFSSFTIFSNPAITAS